jgi:hypothetical protein
MNADLHAPDACPSDHPNGSAEGLAGGAGKPARRIPTGVRGLAANPGPTTSDAQALRIAIRQLTDAELAHEAKVMRSRAYFAQGMADRMESELNKRRRARRQATNEANRGE